MVTRSSTACQSDGWKRELARAHRDARTLLRTLGLSARDIPDLDPEAQEFGLLVPQAFVDLMRPGDPQDPLLRQVLPLRAEHQQAQGFSLDPVCDSDAELSPGLLQKYPGRALLVVNGACAAHCRYCFRRHFSYRALGPAEPRLARAIDRLSLAPSVQEIVLSGGDPLMLDDAQLAELIDRLAAIPHLRRLRIHTRLPIMLPSRVTEALVRMLTEGRLPAILVIHANHPSELGGPAEQALRKLAAHGVRLLNQSVLLRGVNDSVATLQQLSERLFECEALPYYLHQLDRVQGAAHFQVSDKIATILVDQLRARVSGYLAPELVREIPGEQSKARIA
ncbi:EF-P beta-lysylation protein EpmB [Thiorhodococcus minor]|uniref:L-lysine 2,3-aminomutase n=1 Tax=Thiorhodococcus minor TaxID=57489 RepID=A0A6M0JT79_9GAMM|nr:EF-P beta-lysylation protein EpmB [Thiorhodococcus minor]NEV60740.1 EF-P beta-lysylation protein EpmB [Thiorhodococcus minor]